MQKKKYIYIYNATTQNYKNRSHVEKKVKSIT